MLPHVSRLLQDDTHRLIPSAYDEETVLNRLTTDSDELTALFELEGATNERLLGEAGLLPGNHGSGTRVRAFLLPHRECGIHSRQAVRKPLQRARARSVVCGIFTGDCGNRGRVS